MDITGTHSAILQNRAQLELTGVTDVDRFNEEEVALFTQLGELTVRGRGLHINEMSVGSGKLTVEGDISALIYGDKDRQSTPSLWGRIFR